MSNKQQGLIVALIFIGVALLWWWKQDPVLNQLNQQLHTDTQLQAYPYQFHVMRVENGVATLSTPRSPAVSVLHFFKYAFPQLDSSNPDSPEMIAAQKQLSSVQERAAKVVKSQSNIQEIQWEIDKAWYKNHGVLVE